MNINNKIVSEALCLNGQTIDCVAEQVERFAGELKMERGNILRTRISVEEILLRWMEHFGDGTPFFFAMGYRFRRPYISLELSGEVCNPLLTDDDSDGWGNALLAKLGLAPQFSYEKGKNCIFLQLEKYRWNPALKLLVTIAAAVCVGMAGRAFLSTEILAMLTQSVLTPIYHAFLRLLNLASGPVVFLSVLSTIYEVGNMAVLGNIWTKMSSRFIGLCFFFTALSAALCLPLFSVKLLNNHVDHTQFSSLLDLLLNIIPNDLLTPFIQGASPSLILLAVVVGDIFLNLGRQSENAASMAAQAGGAMVRIVDGVNLLGSVVIFVVLLFHAWSGELQGLLGLWKPVLMCVVLMLVYLGAVLLYVSARAKVSLGLLVKKLWDSFWVGLTTGSLTEPHMEAVECCEKRLGISPMVTQYGIPLGGALFMPGVAINALLVSLYMAEQWEVPVSLLWIIMAVILSTILAIAAPPISGAGLITYAAIFPQLGIPNQALAVALVADSLMGFIATALDQTLLELDLTIQAGHMQLLDMEVLHGKRGAVRR